MEFIFPSVNHKFKLEKRCIEFNEILYYISRVGKIFYLATKVGKVLCSFDFQPVLRVPCGDIIRFYYKLRLASHSYALFHVGNKNGY